MFSKTAVLQKLFDIRFSYKHCNFSRVYLLVKMASKTVTRSIYTARLAPAPQDSEKMLDYQDFTNQTKAYFQAFVLEIYWKRQKTTSI